MYIAKLLCENSFRFPSTIYRL